MQCVVTDFHKRERMRDFPKIAAKLIRKFFGVVVSLSAGKSPGAGSCVDRSCSNDAACFSCRGLAT